MREIQLTQGQVALVDDTDFEWLNQYNWWAQKAPNTYYAKGWVKGKTVKMHHLILGKPPIGHVSDHLSGNGCNNQRENLRFITYRQNQQNRRDRVVVRSSQYPGVHWCNREMRWVAKFSINGKAKFLCQSTSELVAFQAYQQAVEFLGESIIDPDLDPYHGIYQKIANDLNDTAIQQRSIS